MPALLIHKQGLYKTEKFKKPNYIGDPINAIKIFNEKEVDELMIYDIDASAKGSEPNFQMIEDVASECFMPLCYGGGVTTIDQMKRIFYSGVEKVSLSSTFFQNPKIVKEAAEMFGSQSVIVTIDFKSDFWGKAKVFTKNGKEKTNMTPEEAVKLAEDMGAGELVLNSIDRDGTMKGLDLTLLEKISNLTRLPLVALGGVGELKHIEELFQRTNIKAVACGSFFVYKGPLRGVLINYPSPEDVERLNQIAVL